MHHEKIQTFLRIVKKKFLKNLHPCENARGAIIYRSKFLKVNSTLYSEMFRSKVPPKQHSITFNSIIEIGINRFIAIIFLREVVLLLALGDVLENKTRANYSTDTFRLHPNFAVQYSKSSFDICPKALSMTDLVTI